MLKTSFGQKRVSLASTADFNILCRCSLNYEARISQAFTTSSQDKHTRLRDSIGWTRTLFDATFGPTTVILDVCLRWCFSFYSLSYVANFDSHSYSPPQLVPAITCQPAYSISNILSARCQDEAQEKDQQPKQP